MIPQSNSIGGIRLMSGLTGALRLTRRLPPTHPCGALRATGRNHDGSFTSIANAAIDTPDPVDFPIMLSIMRWLSTNVSRPVRQSLSLAKADLLSSLANGRVSLAESRFGFNLMKGDGRLWLTTLFRLRSGEPRSAQIGVPRHRSVNLMKRRFPALPCRSTPTSETRPLDEPLRGGIHA